MTCLRCQTGYAAGQGMNKSGCESQSSANSQIDNSLIANYWTFVVQI